MINTKTLLFVVVCLCLHGVHSSKDSVVADRLHRAVPVPRFQETTHHVSSEIARAEAQSALAIIQTYDTKPVVTEEQRMRVMEIAQAHHAIAQRQHERQKELRAAAKTHELNIQRLERQRDALIAHIHQVAEEMDQQKQQQGGGDDMGNGASSSSSTASAVPTPGESSSSSASSPVGTTASSGPSTPTVASSTTSPSPTVSPTAGSSTGSVSPTALSTLGVPTTATGPSSTSTTGGTVTPTVVVTATTGSTGASSGTPVPVSGGGVSAVITGGVISTGGLTSNETTTTNATSTGPKPKFVPGYVDHDPFADGEVFDSTSGTEVNWPSPISDESDDVDVLATTQPTGGYYTPDILPAAPDTTSYTSSSSTGAQMWTPVDTTTSSIGTNVASVIDWRWKQKLRSQRGATRRSALGPDDEGNVFSLLQTRSSMKTDEGEFSKAHLAQEQQDLVAKLNRVDQTKPGWL